MTKRKNVFKSVLSASIVVLLLFCGYQLVFSKPFDDYRYHSTDDHLHMLVGDLETIVTKDLSRIAVSKPSVADVIETKTSEALISGKTPGKTDIYIWDKYGKRKVTVWVYTENLDVVEARIQELLKSADIDDISLERSDLEGKIVLSGIVSSKEKDKFEEIIKPFSGSVINLVKEKEKKELVEFDVQVAEVSSTYTKNLGIAWTNEAGEGDYYFSETLPGGNVKTFGDIFKIGKMARTSAIQAQVNALITEGKGKILSRPKLVTKSGEEASFMVGGQIPVKTTTTSSGGTVTENITFHDYGVTLKVKPVVEEDGKIDIDLGVEVSDIDAQNAVGEDVAYTKREAKTKLYLDSGQTIILAGFMRDNKATNTKRVPLLGSLPLIGLFFRSTTTQPDNQVELFITLTPKIVATNEKKKKEKKEEVSQDIKAPEDKKQEAPVSATTEKPKPTYSSVSVSGKTANYIRSIQERIARNVYYPQGAKDTKEQGTVEVNLSIIKSGALVSASVNKSSGSKLLDEAALEIVQRLSPYSAFPSDVTLKQMTVTIPIVYQLD